MSKWLLELDGLPHENFDTERTYFGQNFGDYNVNLCPNKNINLMGPNNSQHSKATERISRMDVNLETYGLRRDGFIKCLRMGKNIPSNSLKENNVRGF